MAIQNHFADPATLGLAVHAALEHTTLYDRFGPAHDITKAGRTGQIVLDNKANYHGRADVDVARAIGSGRSVGEAKPGSSVSYTVNPKAHELNIDELEYIDNEIGGANVLRERRVAQAGAVVRLKLDNEFVTLMTNTGTYANGALSAIGGNSAKLNWLTSLNADPAGDLRRVRRNRYLATGLWMDTAIMSFDAIEALTINPTVRGYYNNAGSVAGDGSSSLLPDQVVQYLEAKTQMKVVVVDALENTAGYGSAMSLSGIWTAGTVTVCRMGQRNAPALGTGVVTVDPVAAVRLAYNDRGYSDGWRAEFKEINSILDKVAVDCLQAWTVADADLAFILDLTT